MNTDNGIVPETPRVMNGGEIISHELNISCGTTTTVAQLIDYLKENFPDEATVDIDCDHYNGDFPHKTLTVDVSV